MTKKPNNNEMEQQPRNKTTILKWNNNLEMEQQCQNGMTVKE